MTKIAKNEVHLWLVDETLVKETNLLHSYADLLSTEEAQRWQRFIYPQHRHQFLVTRALVRSVLAGYCGVEKPEQLVFDKNAYGKPFLIEPSGIDLQFNLSHTDGLIVLAVRQHKGLLGVDVESLERKAEMVKLAERYFSPQETAELNALDSSQHNKRFFDLWTLKEAYIKACGKGLAIPLEDFSFSFDDSKISISFTPKLDDDPQTWRFWQFEMGSQHQIALAIKGKDLEPYQVVCKIGQPLKKFERVSLQGLDDNKS